MPSDAAGLTVAITSDLGTVGRDAWDRLGHPSVYNSYGWVTARTPSIAGVPKIVLVTADNGAIVAGLPCYLVNEKSHPGYEPVRLLTDEDLVRGAGGTTTRISRLRGELRAHMAEFLPAIAVTSPGRAGGISYGKDVDPAAMRSAAELAVTAVEREATTQGAPTICWMYILDGQDDFLDSELRRRGYTPVVIGAECYMPVKWNSIEEYICNFRSRYRNKIRREMATLAAGNVSITEHGADILGTRLASLEQQWRAKYGRLSPIEDILEEYARLRNHVGHRMHVFTAALDNEILGFTTFLEDDNVWYAGLGGFDYSGPKLFLYYNLLFYAPIAAAINKGVRCIRYTQRSYEAKRARGCLLKNVLAYVRFPGQLSPVTLPYLQAVDGMQRDRFARIAASRIGT